MNKERAFLGASLLVGILCVLLIGVVLKGCLYIFNHLHIVWQ